MNGIWVRTQKAGLINLNNVLQIQARETVYFYKNIKKVPDEESERDFQIIITSTNESNLVIATYSTMERALKVLDEIQKAIEQNQTIIYEYIHSESTKIEYTYPQKVVYEMPKE